MTDEWKKELAEMLRHVAFEHDLPAWKHVVGLVRALAQQLDPPPVPPKGYEYTGEIRFPATGDWIAVGGHAHQVASCDMGETSCLHRILRKLDPQPAAPEGFEFLLDDEGKQVKRPPVKGDWYFCQSGACLACEDHPEGPGWGYSILRKLDLPNAS